METVFIGIGSNLGNREENINQAINYLKKIIGVSVIKVSTLHETDPVDAEGGKFINAVIKIKTDLLPEDLLKALNQIEVKLGRIRTKKNQARTIDLDILLYGSQTITKPNLIVPHPRMWEREFVTKPLREIY